jgi:hypothetical protein
MVLEHLVAMREALRHVESTAIAGTQLDDHVLEIGRRLGPQIDDDVGDGAARTADQLRFGGGRELEMEASHGAAVVVEGDVALRDQRVESALGELTLAEGPREEPAAVAAGFEVDDARAAQRRLREDHLRPSRPPGGGRRHGPRAVTRRPSVTARTGRRRACPWRAGAAAASAA